MEELRKEIMNGMCGYINPDGTITTAPDSVTARVYINNQIAEIKKDLGRLKFSVSDGVLTITDGTNNWTSSAN